MCSYSGRPDKHIVHMLTHRTLLFETMRDPTNYKNYVAHIVRPGGPLNALLGGLEDYVAKTPFLFFVKGRSTATICLACDTRNPCWTTVPPSPMIGVKDFEKYVEKALFDAHKDTLEQRIKPLELIVKGMVALVLMGVGTAILNLVVNGGS